MKVFFITTLFLIMASTGYTQSIEAYPQYVSGDDIFVRVKVTPGPSWNGTSVPVTLYTPTCSAGTDVFVPQSNYGKWITARLSVQNHCSGYVRVMVYSMPLGVQKEFTVYMN